MQDPEGWSERIHKQLSRVLGKLERGSDKYDRKHPREWSFEDFEFLTWSTTNEVLRHTGRLTAQQRRLLEIIGKRMAEKCTLEEVAFYNLYRSGRTIDEICDELKVCRRNYFTIKTRVFDKLRKD